MLGDFLTRAKAAATFLAKAGGTLTGPLVLPGDPGSALEAAPKQYVDTVASPPSSYEVERYRLKAAELEPRLLVAQFGHEVYAVPAGETHLHQYSWNLFRKGATTAARFENRDVTGGMVPMRGIDLVGYALTSMGYWVDPTGVVYDNPKEEYYRKLNIVHARPTRVWHNVTPLATGYPVTWQTFKVGPWGSVAFQAENFDRAWFALGEELSDEAGGATLASPHNNVHHENRFGDSFQTNPVILTHVCSKLGGGAGFNWGREISGVNSSNYAPQNWMLAVNVPLEYHGVSFDRQIAPAGFKFVIDTVTDGVLPANVAANGVGLDIEPDSEWLRCAAGTGWYGTDTTTPDDGESFNVVYFHEGGNHFIGLGTSTSTGAATDYTHAFKIVGNALSVLHDGGAGQVERAFADFSLVVGETYRFKITLRSDGSAYYEFQSTSVPAGSRLPRPIGGARWYDALEGTAPATGTGFTGLRMKGAAVAATQHTVAAPCIANAHADATSAPGYLFHDTMVAVPRVTMPEGGLYQSDSTNLLASRIPNRAQIGTVKWDAGGSNWEMKGYDHAAILAIGAGMGRMPIDFGIADVDIEFDMTVPALPGHNYTRFNNDSLFSASGWYLIWGNKDVNWMALSTASNDEQYYHTRPDASNWPNGGAMSLRLRLSGDTVQVWYRESHSGAWTQIIDRSITGRRFKSQTWFTAGGWESTGYKFHGIRVKRTL